jgi:hypothetical protein
MDSPDTIYFVYKFLNIENIYVSRGNNRSKTKTSSLQKHNFPHYIMNYEL